MLSNVHRDFITAVWFINTATTAHGDLFFLYYYCFDGENIYDPRSEQISRPEPNFIIHHQFAARAVTRTESSRNGKFVPFGSRLPTFFVPESLYCTSEHCTSRLREFIISGPARNACVSVPGVVDLAH